MTAKTFNNFIAAGVGTSNTLLYTASSTTLVLQFDICNILNSEIHVTAWLDRGGTAYRLSKNGDLPVGQTLQVIYGQRLVLKNGDKLYVVSDTAASIDVIGSLLENAS